MDFGLAHSGLERRIHSHTLGDMKIRILLTTIIALLLGNGAHAGLLYNYSQLALKDLDQMSKLVNDNVRESKKSKSGKAVPLKEALQAVYSRPNDDGMIDKVIAPLRSNLDELTLYETTLNQLTEEAINALKNPRAFKPVIQNTYLIFLENLLSEIKPLVSKDIFAKKLAERVRDAKIVVSKEALKEFRLRAMKSVVSPSDLAEQILAQSK